MTMNKKEEIIQAIFSAVDEINLQLPEGQRLQKNLNTTLFGNLDSLGLLNFVVEVEQNIEKAFNISISLADEKAIATKPSPLTSIKILAEYISALMGGENNG